MQMFLSFISATKENFQNLINFLLYFQFQLTYNNLYVNYREIFFL